MHTTTALLLPQMAAASGTGTMGTESHTENKISKFRHISVLQSYM